jgi:hypothetical protein
VTGLQILRNLWFVVGDKAKILPGLKKLGYEIIETDADGNEVKSLVITSTICALLSSVCIGLRFLTLTTGRKSKNM